MRLHDDSCGATCHLHPVDRALDSHLCDEDGIVATFRLHVPGCVRIMTPRCSIATEEKPPPCFLYTRFCTCIAVVL